MNNADEKFPRGGKILFKAGDIKRKCEDTLFATEKQPKAKKSRKQKKIPKAAVTGDSWQAALKFQGTLSYNKMQDGMVILGCIRHISNLSLQVEFPGLTFGHVTINRISDLFSNTLTQKLQEANGEEPSAILKSMFKLGQLVPVKILTIENTDKGYEVQATINPKDINADKVHSSFKKGATIWANAVSELDHGYELTVGVKNCRVFLPYKNIDESKKYAIGEPLYCVVHKAENSIVATTLTVSAKREHLDKVQVEDDLNLHNIIPGMKVEFLVEEMSPHGIKGQFLENCFGYIDETQIFSKINSEKVTEGTALSAYVLFVEPITKVTYLTLRGLETLSAPRYELGTVIMAQVVSNISKGLYLKLGKGDTGFVTNKRLLNTLPKNAELDIMDEVRKKYPVGSRQSCRILDYNRMQQLYICTFEQKLIKEKVFSLKDLKLAQSVVVRVDKIIPSGLIVKTGHVQGFVPNLHLSNTKYTDNIKGKYSPGMTVNARVLNITEDGNVIFTLKQGLVESEKCLANIEDATPNSRYVGFVAQTKISGALIAFYGNVKGWISNKVLNFGNSEGYSDPRDYFFIGQVVDVWVLWFKNEKLQVSLKPADRIRKKKIKVGEIHNGVITGIHLTGIDVEVGKHKTEATIPVPHLSSDLSMCPVLLKTYKVGDELSNLMCVNNSDVPVMSRREFLGYNKNQIKIPKFRELKKDMILRCSFEKKTQSGISVYTPIADHHESITILNKNLSHQTFEKHQSVLAKILIIDYSTRNIELSATTDNDINNALSLLVQNIEDLDRVVQFGRENDWKLTQYKIGEKVECIVQSGGGGDCLVTLPNGVKGSVASHLCPSNVKTGDSIEGVVLDYNFVDDCVEICCQNRIKQNINKIQDGVIKKSLQSSCAAEILLFTKFYALGILKDGQCNRQLVYLPLYSNENSSLKENDKLKIILERRAAHRIIGVPKKLVTALQKSTTSKKTKKNTKVQKEKIVETNDDIDVDEIEVTEDDTNEETSEEDIADLNENSEENADEEAVNGQKLNIAQSFGNNRTQNTGAVLSGVNSFYASEDCGIKEDSSSSDEEAQDKVENKKKKKLTPAERADLAKQEEERILKIEKELADATATPQSAEQFDRLLLANPNSSELWLKYMAMHVATTELEKARTVGKRAIETINMTLVKEKFNIWIALLNLENMYGTKESFEKLFEDAVKYNDSSEMYLSVIKLLATSGKLNEMEEKIKKVKSKDKQNTKMWLEIGQIYYSLGKFREARNIKEAALKSILDNKRQFDLIVRFGIMEFQSGDLEQAIANFETILDAYPAKINIWIIYVDQLVKQKKIDSARKVLERAIRQRFVVKSMKAVFQKFVAFEEQYGTAEAVEEVRERAKEYVRTVKG